jgi:CO/xanthine dehydrogenase Mo-binding subunit
MTPIRPSALSRREFLHASGVLIGFSLSDEGLVPRIVSAQIAGQAAQPAGRLDGWLRIQNDGSIRVFTGKAEIGMGVETAFAQIVAEELNLSTDRVHLTMGDTSTTPDQGGVGGSTSIAQGARPLRNAAATASTLLLQLASQRLGVPVHDLMTADGHVRSRRDAQVGVSYGELAATADLRAPLTVSGQGFALNIDTIGQVKKVADYTVVGTSVPRKDLPPKVLGQFSYTGDIRVPGMLAMGVSSTFTTVAPVAGGLITRP